MKVLKKPDVSNWSLKKTCGKCDTELEIEVSDVKHQYYNGDFRDPGYDDYWANCPVCSAKLAVPKDSMPKLIRIQVEKKTTTSGGSYGGQWGDH